MDAVYSAILHSVSGLRSASHRIAAPGWAPADRVLRAVRGDRTAPSTSSAVDPLPWATWAGSHPITVDAAGLALLTPTRPTPGGHARVIVRSGPESGFAIAVPRGEWTLGRGAGLDVDLADPYLSRRPLTVANGPAGITVGGARLRSASLSDPPEDPPRCIVGSTTLTLVDSTDQTTIRHEADRGTSPSSEPLVWPEPDDVTPVRSSSWIVYAAPIGIGIILALVIGTWWFLLLSLAGPATAAVTLRVERRRFARETVQCRRRHRRAVKRTLTDLDAQSREFSRRLDGIAYGGPNSGAAVPQRDELLVLGTGRCLSTVGVQLPRAPDERARARRRLPPHRLDGDIALLILEDAPLLISRSARVRVTGRSERAHAIVRSLVAAHLAAGGGCAADDAFPEFAGLVDPVGSCRVSHSALQASSTTTLAEVSYEVSGPEADEAPPVEILCGTPARLDALARPGSDPAHGAPSHRIGPARLGSQSSPVVGSPLSGAFDAHRLHRSTFLRLLDARGLAADVRALGPLHQPADSSTSVGDVLAHWVAAGRPGAGPLSVPLGPPAPMPEAPRGTPGRRRGRGTTDAPQDADARVRPADLLALLDLRTSGPHALVAGTTGSGKSVLLEAWLDALCRTHAPDDVRLVLLDFKGGASLSRFLRRPHTDCLVTDLDEPAALRAVRSITAEIGRRERHLARTGCRDIDDLLERALLDPEVRRLPRLVVVIDEFHVLTSLSPHIVAKFEHLTAVGRSLGVHLVLATQRPSGVVSARMRANISLRICLRVRDEADSHEVLGIPDAAWLDPHLPGSALVSDDSGVRAFRSALPDGPESAAATAPHVTVTSLTDAAEVVLPLPLRPPSPPVVADGPPGPRHDVIAPGLPDHLPPAGTTAVGLVDLPDENRVARVGFSAASGSLTVSGGRGRGWSTAVEACARAFHAAGLPVIHLSPRAEAPHVDADGILRLGHAEAWLIDHLIAECERMRRAVVWAVDDWDEFAAAHQTSPRLDALERLLTGSAGMTFVVSGQRRALAQRLSQTAQTRIVFPPASEQDAVFFGLSASRFSGEWPPGRAVILGEAAVTDSHEGADLQITEDTARSDRSPAAESARPHLLWSDFTPAEPGPSASDRPAHAVPIGCDPAGAEVLWTPAADGHVLTVLIPAAEESAGLTAFVDHLREYGTTVVVDPGDPAQRAAADAAASLRRPVCLVSGPPPASRVSGADAAGPTLLLGSWSADSLRLAGHGALAPIPHRADAHWWLAAGTATPIRPLTPEGRAPASCTP
ncbi:FHA domain-containing protein [Brevibacterium jeotgali]|uniref:FtsK/SpoIIIE family protein n=1 Tax=Brevibacterium jeotgali TaxID=1262550 RepID=A0A2H1L5P5_9MICO|nr:FHA domain-containing protein [Brevibacterium jeotgali]TWB98948.1 FtsK/SpoIIIE family protein [Brevibacterium jeotgali]SMY12221.1 FtsK/SpoIIIE family protein [Brevibacterium jeotgali]